MVVQSTQVKLHLHDSGLFVQWVMATAILCVGFAVNAVEGFPPFQPLAMLGGLFWALGSLPSAQNFFEKLLFEFVKAM